ncbi:unnamed protein product [Acanthoscelides obtectus]|uniref:ACB domain-containing protein n=1 Tax=Acanthoscelides obtectus TaxID=200917 RepID=A0A9P0L0G9_ACAOB|nr:unnamed protein product [Acanthoscelides obtectus]CAK1651209.1 hypothetical protein AOBTE_LOCUS17119 [Acanthoscelides obtectus]
MSLDEKFNKAAEDVKNLKSKPSDTDLLEIYALFKQGSVGDVNTGSARNVGPERKSEVGRLELEERPRQRHCKEPIHRKSSITNRYYWITVIVLSFLHFIPMLIKVSLTEIARCVSIFY